MKKHKNKYEFIEIQGIIRKEEQDALQAFHKSDFDSRLGARIRADAEKKTSFLLWIRKPIPILGVTLLIIIAGVILLVNIFFSPPERSETSAIEQFFHNAPGIQRLMKSEEEESHDASQKDKGRKGDFLGEKIKRVYLSVPKARQSLVAGTALIWDEKTLPRFDLRQKIEILIKEQKLNDFLTKYIKKSEEEENGPKNYSFGFPQFFLFESVFS